MSKGGWCGNEDQNLIVSNYYRLPFVAFKAWICILLVVIVVTDSVPLQGEGGLSGSEYELISAFEDDDSQKVNVVSVGDEVLISWDSAVNGTETEGYHVEMLPLNDKNWSGSKNVTVQDKAATFSGLEAGESYRVRVFSESFQSPLETNFTKQPNPPERFVVWYRNETALLIYWQPPSGTFDRYKADISPREGTESTLLVSKEGYQTGEKTPGFYNLTPGRAYNISVMTLSGNRESVPLVKEYRTLPEKPQNVTVSVLELKDRPASITVEWMPPSQYQGDYDGFNVYINHPGVKPMQKFVSRIKPSRAHLADPLLKAGETYQVVVKTLSGKLSSLPQYHNFTFSPNPKLFLSQLD